MRGKNFINKRPKIASKGKFKAFFPFTGMMEIPAGVMSNMRAAAASSYFGNVWHSYRATSSD